MQIFVKFSNIVISKTMVFSVENMCTIHDVKQKIIDKFGKYNCRYILMYRGNILDDNMTLYHYNITDDCFLNLLFS